MFIVLHIQRMLIHKAHYGDFNNSGTFNANAAIDIQCSGLTSCQVKPLCGGNRSCELTVDNNLLSPFCSDTTKQLYIEYTCVDNYPNPITTAFNIRLSKSPNEGFIEVKNDTTWRKVIEENWDKDRQKMLCEHLGFGETSANTIRNMEITANEEIASGDLVCYNTGSGGTSCCVHLVPSTTTAKVDTTYAECKICDNQLLNDESTFPDNIFRGNGGNSFHEARFTKGGWCSSTPGSYLTIDLQKEYHITRVSVMGDKDQTKWSGSYSLKYSHDESLVDSSRVVQILGNQNGYQALTTDVDIYNARFLKIESTGTADFCLRIELCGLAQKPASVSDIQITTFERSARVTWSIETSPTASSYITKLEIYLNDNLRKTILRGNSYQFDISNLTPFTKYTVGIEAVDGSSESSRINRDFETKEAVPSGPPLDVKFESRGKTTLQLSWMDPRSDLHNGILRGYQVCYSSQKTSTSPKCNEITTLSFTIDDLRPSTKYFVTVAAGTRAGFGIKSAEINKTTNGDPVQTVANSPSSLKIDLSKPDKYVQDVMIIVKTAENILKPVEEIKTSDLKPYQSNTQDPYITAYLKTDVLPSSFVIGDGKEYKYKNMIYVNQRLQPNSSYNVFLRFFESQRFFYSTEWSKSVKTMAIPPAPVISKITPTGRNEYNISWYQPLLPDQQTVLKYHVNYSASNEPTERSTSNNFIIIEVDYDKRYTINIRVETEAGKSQAASKSWLSLSEPLKPPKRTTDSYIVILRKPNEKKNIRTVALVLLLSESSVPPAPGDIKIESSFPPKNRTDVAFIAKEFNISDFQSDTIEISLQESRNNRRRKREAVKIKNALRPNETYRTAQMNTDESGNRTLSFWSESFKVGEEEDSKGEKNGASTPSTAPTTTTTRKVISATEDREGGGGDGASVATAVGGAIAAVVVIIALILAFLYFRRRRTNRDKETGLHGEWDEKKGIRNDNLDETDAGVSPDNQPVNANDEGIYSNEAGDFEEKQHPSVPVKEFAHFVNEMKANGNYEFNKEYNDLPKTLNSSWEVSKKLYNKPKNRYGNIVTYDHSRVVLSGDEKTDYINASYIDGIKEKSYIACQGPRTNTVNDMWRMVWEQRSYSIVMVTSLVELGKPKCEKYWPDNGSEMYGDIEVTLMKTEEFAYHVTHILRIEKDDEEREVRHYYFQSWPDHGVPKYPTQLLAFRRLFRTHHMQQSGPIVVHCSAGVGRTGVFLAIDTILERLEKGVINSIDVFGHVCAMRERRMNMIQTLEQYIFVHDAILETILCGMNEVDASKLQKEVANLSEVKASGMTGFEEKFKRLVEVSPKLSEDECAAALLDGNHKKNRNKNVLPAEGNRVPLQYMEGVDDSDYINAVFVHGYLGRNYFIATQSPLPGTINDFWRLIHSQKSSTIVLLNNVKDGTSFPIFWPTNRGEPKQYGTLTVQLDSEKESDGIWTRKFIISPYPDLTDGQVVNIFQYTKWPDHRTPPDANGVISLTSLVENSRKSFDPAPIIVACSDGAGRTGTYIAISNLLERMKIEQAMDVFQAIKIIRGIRPQFVENAEQYQFCYKAMMTYLDSFSEYANFE
ncbi:receptor-type tyrosine-protein phosphatase delta-like isoform X10 [Dendronephthya gigantea]|uniref:receptor-type tyrosine-protein phosphatase delta-like isoform X10 n=1 Tax=Dendronephthya gigantea TaxID=151771 RepID=UPI001069689B|nr:receptor-type tyrosine-protein phosphatase delta-like isoform X10 [Dendronephthya gigantea]XP_028402581.1 receptor-type tyrosine-protein phosphatase delta-like isoform X10 [Dendronephthya gigantea]XP_028402582.1 receptor-type tyrosine-protein phosphatase delta-like isoform X10 [Dendronephthya gigantea]